MAVFCISLTSCFRGMLLTYFLNDFEIVSFSPVITGITFVFTFHMRCISIVRSLYFKTFSASFLITFLSPEIAYYYYYYSYYYYYFILLCCLHVQVICYKLDGPGFFPGRRFRYSSPRSDCRVLTGILQLLLWTYSAGYKCRNEEITTHFHVHILGQGKKSHRC